MMVKTEESQLIIGFNCLRQFSPEIISTHRFGQTIPFILQSKWPCLILIAEVLALTVTLDYQLRLNVLFL